MLQWTLRWGKELKLLLEIQESTGMTPKGLQERPAIKPACLPYWEAFWAVSRGRGSGMSGPNPIAVSEVLAYLQLVEERNVAERLKILKIIQALDAVYLSHQADKSAPAAKP